MMGFVYVLHFHQPLHHAAHYTGSTRDLRRRLETHARGFGSRLTRAMMLRGLEWQLGGLYMATLKTMRKMEMDAKSQHQGSRFCTICKPDGSSSRLTGAIPYDITNLKFPSHSEALRFRSPSIAEPEFRLMSEHDTPDTWERLRRLQKQDSDALGFIPTTGQEGLALLAKSGQIVLALRDSSIIGYLAFTVNTRAATVRIQQTVVDDRHRLTGVGNALLSRVETRYLDMDFQCKVREDLPANGFWLAQNYRPIGASKHPTSGSTLIHYKKEQVDGQHL